MTAQQPVPRPAFDPAVRIIAPATFIEAGLPSTLTLVLPFAAAHIEYMQALLRIRCVATSVHVLCMQGGCSVRRGDRAVALTRGSRVTSAPDSLGSAAEISAYELLQRDSMLLFHHQRLELVIDELSRRRAASIIIGSHMLARLRVSGVFDLDRPDAIDRELERSIGARTRKLPGGMLVLT